MLKALQDLFLKLRKGLSNWSGCNLIVEVKSSSLCVCEADLQAHKAMHNDTTKLTIANRSGGLGGYPKKR